MAEAENLRRVEDEDFDKVKLFKMYQQHVRI